jgi:predicted amidohydrolase
MNDCHDSLSEYARQNSMNILMSNYCGQLWGTEAGGRSAFWSNNGELIKELPEDNPGLLLINKDENGWIGKTILN